MNKCNTPGILATAAYNIPATGLGRSSNSLKTRDSEPVSYTLRHFNRQNIDSFHDAVYLHSSSSTTTSSRPSSKVK